jgi:kelch-like protein 2/3
MPYRLSRIPPWKLAKPEIDLSLRSLKKGSTDALIFQGKFWELGDKYPQHLAIYTDGSKDNDKVGAAATCCGAHKQIRLPKSSSIYTAELYALQMAFNIAMQSPHTHFVIFTDSLSSLSALNGNKLDHPSIIELLEKHSRLVLQGNSITLAWLPSHVGIKGNDKADSLAKGALRMEITNVKIPYTDLKFNVNNYMQNKWQALWDTFPNNKLHIIQPKVNCTSVNLDKRRDDIVINRARIGHTFLTHAYLLRGEQAPECVPCDTNVTVKHILIDCIDYTHIRQKYYNEPDLKKLFANVHPAKILGFLKEINLYMQF